MAIKIFEKQKYLITVEYGKKYFKIWRTINDYEILYGIRDYKDTFKETLQNLDKEQYLKTMVKDVDVRKFVIQVLTDIIEKWDE